MNSTPASKGIEPDDALIARADERIAHAYEQIVRADKELARVTEQLAKMERDDERAPSAGPSPQSPPASPQPPPTNPQSPPRRPGLLALVGLPLVCIVVAALALQSSYGGGAKLVVARLLPRLVSTPPLPPKNAPLPAPPAPSVVQLAAAETAPTHTTLLAQAGPPDAAPTATAAPPDQAQLLQTMARDLANAGRDIEQLKANQQQMASDNSKAIEQLKASQEEIKRVLAKVSEPNPTKTSLPPTPPVPTVRKLGRMVQPPHARYQPRVQRMPRGWVYDDDYW